MSTDIAIRPLVLLVTVRQQRDLSSYKAAESRRVAIALAMEKIRRERDPEYDYDYDYRVEQPITDDERSAAGDAFGDLERMQALVDQLTVAIAAQPPYPIVNTFAVVRLGTPLGARTQVAGVYVSATKTYVTEPDAPQPSAEALEELVRTAVEQCSYGEGEVLPNLNFKGVAESLVES